MVPGHVPDDDDSLRIDGEHTHLRPVLVVMVSHDFEPMIDKPTVPVPIDQGLLTAYDSYPHVYLRLQVLSLLPESASD